MIWQRLALLCASLMLLNTGCDLLNDPCSEVECAPGQQCSVIGEVADDCEGTACTPAVACVPSNEELPSGGTSCAATLCIEGTTCVERDGQAVCVPATVDGGFPEPCADLDCPIGSSCEVQTDGSAACVSDPLPPADCGDCPIESSACAESSDGSQYCILPNEDSSSEFTCANILCFEGTDCIETPEGPSCVPSLSCANVLCIEGTNCIETPEGPTCVPNLTCASVLCEEGTNCIETPEGPTCVPNLTCASVLCLEGTSCVETPEGPVCTPNDDPCATIDCPVDRPVCTVDEAGVATCVASGAGSTCAATTCPENTYCDDISGTAKCIELPSCNDIDCKEGTSCELVSVECIRAPCPPVPQCVEDPVTDPCATVRCAAGTHCESTPIQCLVAPCDAITQCVPDEPATCGSVTCEAGTSCCNASCGICTPPGVACTQQACDPTE